MEVPDPAGAWHAPGAALIALLCGRCRSEVDRIEHIAGDTASRQAALDLAHARAAEPLPIHACRYGCDAGLLVDDPAEQREVAA